MMRREEEKPAPWERQPGESAKAYHAFCIYRDMPPRERSLRAVSARLKGQSGKAKKVSTNVYLWSRDWSWQERAKAWDEERERQEREAELEAIKEMRRRHAKEAVALQTKALERLQMMDPDELSPESVLRFIVEAAKLERISRGEPETIQEQRGGWVDAVLAVWERRRKQIEQEQRTESVGEPDE